MKTIFVKIRRALGSGQIIIHRRREKDRQIRASAASGQTTTQMTKSIRECSQNVTEEEAHEINLTQVMNARTTRPTASVAWASNPSRASDDSMRADAARAAKARQ